MLNSSILSLTVKVPLEMMDGKNVPLAVDITIGIYISIEKMEEII